MHRRQQGLCTARGARAHCCSGRSVARASLSDAVKSVWRRRTIGLAQQSAQQKSHAKNTACNRNGDRDGEYPCRHGIGLALQLHQCGVDQREDHECQTRRGLGKSFQREGQRQDQYAADDKPAVALVGVRVIGLTWARPDGSICRSAIP